MGIETSRIEFVGTLSRQQYLRLYTIESMSVWIHSITLATPQSLDSLWMGIPPVTLFGPSAVSRGTLSQLSNLGLESLAAETEEQYIEIAVGLAICGD